MSVCPSAVVRLRKNRSATAYASYAVSWLHLLLRALPVLPARRILRQQTKLHFTAQQHTSIAKLGAPAILQQSCLPHPLASHVHARSLSVAAAAYLPTLDLSQNSWHSRLVNSKDGRMGQGYWAQMTKRKMARDADYCMPVKVCCLCFPRKSRQMQTLGSSYDKICRSWTQKDISVICGVLLVKTRRHCSPCGE